MICLQINFDLAIYKKVDSCEYVFSPQIFDNFVVFNTMEVAKVSGIFGAKDFFLSKLKFPEVILDDCHDVKNLYVTSLDVRISDFVNAAVATLEHQQKVIRLKGTSNSEMTMIVLLKYYSKLNYSFIDLVKQLKS